MEVRYAISDLHGNGRQFLELLDHVDPDPEQMVICGDLCNRGLDTWSIYEEVDQLIDEGCQVVMGNHDYWYMQLIAGGLSKDTFIAPDVGGITTLKSFEIAETLHGQKKVDDVRSNVFKAMKMYVETDDFIFVHAGLDPRLPYMNKQSTNTLIMGCNEWKNPQLDHSFEQTVVFGHTPTYYIHKGITEQEATVWFSRARRKMAIDTGAGFGHRLTMVDLQTGKAYAYDFSKRKILEYQFMNPKGFRKRYY